MAACLYLDESKVGLVAVGTLVGSSSHQPYSALLDFLNKSHTLVRVAQRTRHVHDTRQPGEQYSSLAGDSGDLFWDPLMVP